MLYEIIGPANLAREVRKRLERAGVSASAIAPGDTFTRADIVSFCLTGHEERVIVVFPHAFPEDNGAGLIASLWERAGKRVSIHAIVRGIGSEEGAAEIRKTLIRAGAYGGNNGVKVKISFSATLAPRELANLILGR